MKETALRMGNWVECLDDFGQYQVIAMSIGGKATIEREGLTVCEFNELQPIPLTAKWFRKLGFKERLFGCLPFRFS